MPHIAIKMIGNCSAEKKRLAAEACRDAIIKYIGKPEKYVSVTFEEYGFGDEWAGVYDEYIAKGDKEVLIKPGYTDPVTFA